MMMPFSLQFVIDIEADEHIFKFIQSKFGVAHGRYNLRSVTSISLNKYIKRDLLIALPCKMCYICSVLAAYNDLSVCVITV